MPVEMTLYDTLEVGPHASQFEIKRAYRRLAKRHHPDLNPGDPEAEERFKELVAAYEILCDRDRRADYDAGLRDPFQAPATTGAPRPPPRTSEEWKDLDRDLRRWYRGPALDVRDAHLGALLSVSLTLASHASHETGPFLFVLGVALLVGTATSLPFRAGFFIEWPLARWLGAVAAPLVAAAGAAAGASLMSDPPALWDGSGVPYAFAGGTGGAVFGATCGRALRVVAGPAAGLVGGGISGAALGAGIAGFFWFWATVFRWMEWPARDDLSIVASVGIIGALLGAAVAAALEGARGSKGTIL